MGAHERRARQKQLLRQEILDAARELLVRDGYDALSMRKVAERIDYSPTAIYLHFKDKQELVSSLCDETFARLVRELETLKRDYPDPLVRLRKGLERYIAFGLTNPNHYIPTFVLPPPLEMNGKRTPDIHNPEANGMRALATLRETIADGVKAKKLRKVDPDIAARAAWAAVHGITSLMIAFTVFPWGDRDEVIKNVIDMIVDGLRRR
jgi:AcrR family transcriptional regulator